MSGAVPKTRLLVDACLRASNARGTPAYLVRRGYAEAGAVLIKLNLLNGDARVLCQIWHPDRGREWSFGTGAAPVPDAEAEAYIERQIRIDPDIWVIEVEDPEARHPLDEPIGGN